MINPNEAPEGYVAVQEVSAGRCTGCVFSTVCTEDDRNCMGRNRKDGHDVIFKEMEDE